jgi:CheY-like chemotaxis protein
LNLHQLIRNVGDVVRSRAAPKGISLSVVLAPDLPQAIVSDAAKIRQILVNLTGNAVKFTKEGGVAVRADRTPDGRLRLAVEDTGMGIAADEIDEIFDPFKQVEAGKAAGGTGLGLAITRRLIDALNGELTVTSQQGEGSTFTVFLPLTETTAGDVSDLPEEVSLSSDRLVLADGQDFSILVADDRETNRDVLHGMLVAAGFKTVLAADGDEALMKLREHPEVSLVLMDLRMPRMSGLDALRQIREDPQLRSLKVIAVTASVYPGYKQQALNDGFDDFLGKPFRIAKLMEKLKRHLGAEFRSLSPDDSGESQRARETVADVCPRVPQHVIDRLRQALSIKNLTVIKSVADELSAATATCDAGKHIHKLVRAFDFNQLDEFVQQLERNHGPE